MCYAFKPSREDSLSSLWLFMQIVYTDYLPFQGILLGCSVIESQNESLRTIG